MKVREIKALTRENKASGFSVLVDDGTPNGKSGLVTQQNVGKYGGKVEQIKVGDDIPVVFEEVQKKQGGGTWTSATFPTWETQESKANTSGGGGYTKSYTRGGGDDAYSKIVNNSMLTAATVFAQLPAGTTASVVQVFNELCDAALAKYEQYKK
jgi:hypothetical protein